jgi:hypothetical protein
MKLSIHIYPHNMYPTIQPSNGYEPTTLTGTSSASNLGNPEVGQPHTRPRATLDHVTIERLKPSTAVSVQCAAHANSCPILQLHPVTARDIPLLAQKPSGPIGRLRKASPHSEPRCPLVARHLPSLKGQEPLDSSTSTTNDPHLPITKPAAPPPWTQTWKT